MGLSPGIGFSVRGITAVGLAALALLCLAVAGGVAFIAIQLQSTSAALVRDTESLRLITQIELQLLDYQRLSVFTDDPVAQAERREVRQELQASIQEAGLYAASAAEAELVRQTGVDIEEYLQRRDGLMEMGIGPLEVQRLARDDLDVALEGLDVLGAMNRDAVERDYVGAQRVGSFFIVAAAATVLLTAGMLLVMILAIRHMLLRPIFGIRSAIDRFRAGEQNVSADEHAPRELSEIARAFNEMSEELSRQKAHQLAFVAGVAHDLRNPLTALQYGVEAMQLHEASENDDAANTLPLISRQLDHLAHMVDDLLETSSIEAGALILRTSLFDLKEAVRSVLDLYRLFAPSRTFELDLSDAPALVDADRTRIEQVVGNLLSNAIKYSPADTPIGIRVMADGEVAQLMVKDSGIGIDACDIEQIFRPFWRSGGLGDRSGSGLGLSVVRKIVAAHGGNVDVESRPGVGSVFRVVVPLAQAPQQQTRQQQAV